jgi:hypothetical protein
MACLDDWSERAATTRLRYVHSLIKLIKHYRADAGLIPATFPFLALRKSKLEAATHIARRARVLSSRTTGKVLHSSRLSRKVRAAALLTVVSASRFDDLTRPSSRLTVKGKKVIKLTMPTDKGRPFGRVGVKWISAASIIKALKLKPGPLHLQQSYSSFRRALNKVAPMWTGHSGRRTACLWLSKAGTTLKDIQRLTLHSGMEERSLETTRTYVDPVRSSPEARIQLRLTRTLARKATSTKRH